MSSHPLSMKALKDTWTSARAEPDVAAARRALAAVPDRATREAAAALARQEYTARLKDVRGRKGITLQHIAEITKINESLFTALERGDLSRWPAGIYRRAFFREYAGAIGLPLDAAVSEFLQIFPDDAEPRSQPAPAAVTGPLRMTLARSAWIRFSRVQLVAALIDLAMVAAITAAVAWWMPVGLGTVAAIVTVIYYSLATACLSCSPGSWWLRTKNIRKRAKGIRLAR